RADPVRLTGRHLPARGIPDPHRAGPAHRRRRDGPGRAARGVCPMSRPGAGRAGHDHRHDGYPAPGLERDSSTPHDVDPGGVDADGFHPGGTAGDRQGMRVNTVRLLPSTITIAALCSGLSAIHFALLDQAGVALALIALAAVLDSLDGRVAWMLDATSRIGA